jgi:molecular chaperone Hsp33
MHDRDSLHRFMFEHFPIRGQLVHVDAAWRALIEHSEYPAAIRDTLGQAVAASLLLAATIKFKGVLSLQLQGDGPVHLMLVQCSDGLGVRGLARFREEAAGQANPAALFGSGNLTVTLETESSAQRYQGIVPITGERLAGASGMLLQKLPAQSTPAVEDAWRRVQIIGDTLTPEELSTLADQEILHRLFNEDDVRLYEAAPVYFRCRCSRERVAGMLQGLGEREIRSVIAERGEVEVRCDFCNRAYTFDAVDAAQLFNAGVAADRGTSLH